MSHDVERSIHMRRRPWHHGMSNSQTFDAPIEFDRIAIESGTASQSLLCPAFFQAPTGEFIPIEDRRWVVRSTDLRVLSEKSVSDHYQCQQNEDYLEIMREAVEAGAVEIECAGSLKKGSWVFYLWRIAKDATGEISPSDRYQQYLVQLVCHDGCHASYMLFTLLRVECANLMAAAIAEADKAVSTDMDTVIRFAHKGDHSARLAYARDSINFAQRKFDATMSDLKTMSRRPLPRGGLESYVASILDVELATLTSTRAWEQIDAAYYTAPGATLPHSEGTYYGAFNAVTYWLTHSRKGTQDTRFAANIIGSAIPIRERAYALALGQSIEPIAPASAAAIDLN